MAKQLTPSDIFDVNPKTGALILGANRLDDYATKFLKKFCEQALTTPMPLPIDEMLRSANLTVETAPLSRDLDVFGCCMLLDGYVQVYNAEKHEYVPTFYPGGTLLFDPNSEWMYSHCHRKKILPKFLKLKIIRLNRRFVLLL